MFTAVRSPRVYEHIVDQVERAIFDGRLHSGDRLPPEREMVRQFGASRVAVHEALRSLEEDHHAHREIFAAVAGRDPLGARAAMQSHVMDLQRRLGRMEVARHPA